MGKITMHSSQPKIPKQLSPILNSELNNSTIKKVYISNKQQCENKCSLNIKC